MAPPHQARSRRAAAVCMLFLFLLASSFPFSRWAVATARPWGDGDCGGGAFAFASRNVACGNIHASRLSTPHSATGGQGHDQRFRQRRRIWFFPRQQRRGMLLEKLQQSTRLVGGDWTLLLSRHDNPSDTAFETANVHVTGVTLKLAMDIKGHVGVEKQQKDDDDDLSPPPPPRFTSEASLDAVHRLRRDSDAVLVGRKTVQVDDCSLTVRRVSCQTQPVRIILDTHLQTFPAWSGCDYQVWTDGYPTLFYHSSTATVPTHAVIPSSVTLVPLERTLREESSLSPRLIVQHFTSYLEKEKQRKPHVMMEGGPTVAKSFLQENLVDRVLVVVAPLDLTAGGGKGIAGISNPFLEECGFECVAKRPVGDDTWYYWSRKDEHQSAWPTTPVTDWP